MNDKPCIITINGTDYYYPCDRRDDIIKVGNHLVNVGSSTITMYRDFVTYGDSSSGYPRITMPSNTYAYYRSTATSNTTTMNISSVEFKQSSFSYSIMLMIVIIGILLLNLFKKR